MNTITVTFKDNTKREYRSGIKLREIILNLIIYGTELEEGKIPVDYLMNTLYLLRNFDNKIAGEKAKWIR